MHLTLRQRRIPSFLHLSSFGSRFGTVGLGHKARWETSSLIDWPVILTHMSDLAAGEGGGKKNRLIQWLCDRG